MTSITDPIESLVYEQFYLVTGASGFDNSTPLDDHMDSLDIVELTVKLEDKLNIDELFANDDFKDIITVGDVVDRVREVAPKVSSK